MSDNADIVLGEFAFSLFLNISVNKKPCILTITEKKRESRNSHVGIVAREISRARSRNINRAVNYAFNKVGISAKLAVRINVNGYSSVCIFFNLFLEELSGNNSGIGLTCRKACLKINSINNLILRSAGTKKSKDANSAK